MAAGKRAKAKQDLEQKIADRKAARAADDPESPWVGDAQPRYDLLMEMADDLDKPGTIDQRLDRIERLLGLLLL